MAHGGSCATTVGKATKIAENVSTRTKMTAVAFALFVEKFIYSIFSFMFFYKTSILSQTLFKVCHILEFAAKIR
jgi:hypothetical protein